MPLPVLSVCSGLEQPVCLFILAYRSLSFVDARARGRGVEERTARNYYPTSRVSPAYARLPLQGGGILPACQGWHCLLPRHPHGVQQRHPV